jgi:two-component system, LytTR family, response regulator
MTQMIRTVIVDDEKASRASLKHFLQVYCDNCEVVGSAESTETARPLIKELQPELVFLDIMMPPSDGFTLLKLLEPVNFEVVFTSAHNEFGIQAVKASAIDYLLKPIRISELQACMRKAQEKITQKANLNQMPTGKIAFPTTNSFVFLTPKEIIRAEVHDGRKTIVYLIDGSAHIVAKGITELEEMLQNFQFFRAHRAYLVNIKEISKYIPDKTGGFVIMTDGKNVPIAARKKQEFLMVVNKQIIG